MNRTLFHILPIALLASIQGYCESNLDKRIGKLETDMKKISAVNEYGHLGPRTASANPQIDGFGFFATADFLWWKLYEGGTDYLFKAKNDRGIFPVKGNIKHFNFEWEPGFKVGLGYLFEHDGWEANIEFTYFKTHARSSASSHSPDLFPLAGNPVLNFTKAKGHWHVNFYDIDFVLGRNYFVSKFLSLCPFFGLASAWIDQHRRIHFIAEGGDRIVLKNKNDFWGIGPRLGLDAQFAFCEHYSCYGNISGNLLWGDFHVNEFDKDNTTNIEFHDLHYNLHRMVPNVAFGLGLAYETTFAQNCYHLLIKCGYENQYWWRQNQLPIPDVNSLEFRRASQDLSMQGLTVEFRLDF